MRTYPEVEALLGRMTLEQKVGQMTQTERLVITADEVKRFHIGSVLSGGGSAPGENLVADWVEMNEAYWQASMSEDEHHIAIPLLYGVDAIHGNNNVKGATVFPHNLGLGAARDIDLMRRIGQVTAKEILASGVEWTFAPTLAVAHDPRWGRTYESYGRDASLIRDYAYAMVQGLQADLGDDGVLACAKHWVGDGGTTHGIDQGETTVSWEELRKVHIEPYLGALGADVQSVMVSFNSWNGDKCHGHKHLLQEVLKGQLGFDGFVISDWDGIDYLDDDYRECVRLSVNAGIDLFMVSEKWQQFIAALLDLVASGEVVMSRIDDAVRRILNVKHRYGLFDRPSPANRKWSNHESFGSEAHRAVAREAVQKSLVLLKNRHDLLPLKPARKIVVTGRLADDVGAQCGGFTIAWQGQTGSDSVPGATSIWQGIKAIAPDSQLMETGDVETLATDDVDAAVVVIGENPYAEGMGDIRESENVVVEAGSQIKGSLKVLGPYGTSLRHQDLHPEDLELLISLNGKNIPTIVVFIAGRPSDVSAEISLADSFVAAWLPGSEGAGVADVLFGNTSFVGQLPCPWPSVTQQAN
jgi:beta-glucosidase